MKQLSLLDDVVRLSGVMAAIKTAMRDAAGAPEGEGRKMLADRLNEIALVHRSMRARPFAGAARPGGALPPVPPLPPDPKAGQHGPAALFAAAAAPGPFQAPCELSRNLRISVTQLENGTRRFFVPGTVIA